MLATVGARTRCGVARLPRAPRRWRGKGRMRARARECIAVDGLVSKGQRRPRPKDQFPVGMRVLAVDDDPTCLKVLENLLFRCQYHVTTMGQATTTLSC
ncbi:ubiquitin carrier protein 7 [Zea mays]|uniref:Ubiquitin carrier protein 7 n=1 Tax=Zea mays TaxID=4577 RepID=A0A1D6K783_MAIZE|nr:ubiquitin carrier protein 7 [Zea mays]